MGMWPDHNHAASWSVTDYLLANLIDAVRELSYITLRVNAGKNAHIKKPEPVYRPGAKQTPQANRVRWSDLPKMFGASSNTGDSRLSEQSEQSEQSTTQANGGGLNGS